MAEKRARRGRELARDGFTAVALPAVGISIIAWAGLSGFGPYRRPPFVSAKGGKPLLLAWPFGFPHSGDAPPGRALMWIEGGVHEPLAPAGVLPRSPAPRRLRSACAQVAFSGVCEFCVEDQDQDQELWLWLCFLHDSADAAERDVGAGRVEALRRGERGRSRVGPQAMNGALNQHQGTTPGATPEGGNPAGAQPGAMALVTFPERKVTRP